MALLDAIIGPISQLLDRIIPDPRARDLAKLELLKLQGDQEMKSLATQMQARVGQPAGDVGKSGFESVCVHGCECGGNGGECQCAGITPGSAAAGTGSGRPDQMGWHEQRAITNNGPHQLSCCLSVPSEVRSGDPDSCHHQEAGIDPRTFSATFRAMNATMEAVYESGNLRLLSPLPLPEQSCELRQ